MKPAAGKMFGYVPMVPEIGHSSLQVHDYPEGIE